MRIYSSRQLSKLIREKEEFAERYNRSEELRGSQIANLNDQCFEFAEVAREKIKSKLSNDTKNLPGLTISCRYEGFDYDNDSAEFSVVFKLYQSSYPRKKSSEQFSWSIGFDVILKLGKVRLVRDTHLRLDIDGRTNNYDLLLSTYNLAQKINSSNFDRMVKNIFKDAPIVEDIVTEPYMENDIDDYNEKIFDEVIFSILGKDLWVNVKYEKWIKVNRIDRDNRVIYIDEVNEWNFDPDSESYNTVDKIKFDDSCSRGYFTISTPIEILTTEELQEYLEKLNEVQGED